MVSLCLLLQQSYVSVEKGHDDDDDEDDENPFFAKEEARSEGTNNARSARTTENGEEQKIYLQDPPPQDPRIPCEFFSYEIFGIRATHQRKTTPGPIRSILPSANIQ